MHLNAERCYVVASQNRGGGQIANDGASPIGPRASVFVGLRLKGLRGREDAADSTPETAILFRWLRETMRSRGLRVLGKRRACWGAQGRRGDPEQPPPDAPIASRC